MIPVVLHVGYEVVGANTDSDALKMLAHVRRDDRTAVISVRAASVLLARHGAKREVFLDELSRELCRVGMHHPGCCVRVEVAS